jgi:hypothetical protein
VSGIWNIIVLRYAIPYNIVDKYSQFRVNSCVFLQGKYMKAVCPSDDNGTATRGVVAWGVVFLQNSKRLHTAGRTSDLKDYFAGELNECGSVFCAAGGVVLCIVLLKRMKV